MAGVGVMPNRIIRENILSSEPVASLKWDEEVFYRRLMSIVDDYGRHEASPQLLRAKCYPLQTDHVRVADITRWMAACQKSGLILGYAKDGKAFLEICKFGQQVRSSSKCPAPLATDISCDQLLAVAHLDVSVSVSEGVSVSDNTSADAALFPNIPAQIVKDFKALRKTKRAAITATAVAGIQREADKAGMTLGAVLAMCCERGWASFKAEWANGDPKGKPAIAQSFADKTYTGTPDHELPDFLRSGTA